MQEPGCTWNSTTDMCELVIHKNKKLSRRIIVLIVFGSIFGCILSTIIIDFLLRTHLVFILVIYCYKKYKHRSQKIEQTDDRSQKVECQSNDRSQEIKRSEARFQRESTNDVEKTRHHLYLPLHRRLLGEFDSTS
jgi:hypothetical protein